MEIESIKGQDILVNELIRVFKIFKNSNYAIKPHFILTGESGSGKSFTIKTLAQSLDIGFLEINGASLTKEGTSGNSLSKALSPLAQSSGLPTIVFVDEFDKLFISGNNNTDLAHESTNGVQNEFLKVLESSQASVFGDYGKYINVDISNVLFVFAGAFNGVPKIDIDILRSYGLKTEFLGRVGLVFNTERLSLKILYDILESSPLLGTYLKLFSTVERTVVIPIIQEALAESFSNNTLGARSINTLIHQYFIEGSNFRKEQTKVVTFQSMLYNDETK